MELSKIVELKLQALEREYQECNSAYISITNVDEFKGLKAMLADSEDDGFGNF